MTRPTDLKAQTELLNGGAPITADHAVQLARAVLSLSRFAFESSSKRGLDPRVQLARAVLKRVNTVVLDDFARDMLDKCIWVSKHNYGWLDSGWPAQELLAVALVLDDNHTLSSAGYTVAEAQRVVADGMASPPKDMATWVQQIRDAIDTADE